jgi:uncharacterized membrane protein
MTGVETGSEREFAVPSSRAAALATLASAVVSLAGIAGQIGNAGSVVFPVITAFGLSTLATIVLVHQRQ